MYLQCYICLLSLANSFQNTKLSLSNSPPPLSVSRLLLPVLLQFLWFQLQLWWGGGVHVRGGDGPADGGSGGEEETDRHHQEQAVEDEAEAHAPQVISYTRPGFQFFISV